MSRRARAVAGLSLILTVLLLAPAAGARGDDGIEQARTSFERGVEASHAQRWNDARQHFERSLALVPKASTMFNLALVDIKLGLGREALEQLDAFERAANAAEHAAMLERARVLRPQAQALVDSEHATAQSGGNLLSRADGALDAEVRADVASAREHYARGRDREALADFERAYRASQRPELLYNIGVVADRLRDDARAVDAYERFVAALPDAPEAAVAEVRSEALRAALAARRSADLERPARTAEALDGIRLDARDRGDAARPELRTPRLLAIAGSVLAVASLSTFAWLVPRWVDYNKCLAPGNPDGCANVDAVRDDRPLVIAGTVSSGALGMAGLAMTAAGAVLLAQRKQRRRLAGLVPAFALGTRRELSIDLQLRY